MKFYTTNMRDFFVYEQELEERRGKYYRRGLPINREDTFIHRTPMDAADSILKRLGYFSDKKKANSEYKKFIFSFAGLFDTVNEFFDPSERVNTGIIEDVCRVKLGMQKEYEFFDLFPAEQSLSIDQLCKIGPICESIESRPIQNVIHVNAFGKTAIYREDDCNPGDFWFDAVVYQNNLYGMH